jgi:hypothetical protein
LSGIESSPHGRSFFAALFVAAFGLNWLWEMLQMSAYAQVTGSTWRGEIVGCTLASLGDAIVTLGIYAVGALAAWRWRWEVKATWKGYAALALVGAACAVVIEWAVLALGYWSYSSRMVVVPVFGVGLWPVLQLALLVPGAVRLAAWWSGRTFAQP